MTSIISKTALFYAPHILITKKVIKNSTIGLVAKKNFSALCTNFFSPRCLGLTGIYSSIEILIHLAPMYTPFFIADARSWKKMSEKDPKDAETLRILEESVRKQAKMMGAKWADKINVRFGAANETYGCRFSIGGPLLLISKSEAPKMLKTSGGLNLETAIGRLNRTGKRIVAHELTHIIEKHSLWGMPGRITGIVIACGFFVAISGMIPTIPVISKVVAKIAFFAFRKIVTGFATAPLNRYFERRADRGTIHLINDPKQALKIAMAGQRYFNDKAQKNLALKKQAIAKGGLKSIWHHLCTNDKGERRFDFAHPGYMERVAFFKQETMILSRRQMQSIDLQRVV